MAYGGYFYNISPPQKAASISCGQQLNVLTHSKCQSLGFFYVLTPNCVASWDQRVSRSRQAAKL